MIPSLNVPAGSGAPGNPPRRHRAVMTVGGEPVTGRLMRSIAHTTRYGDAVPTAQQVVAVLRSMADYTALQQALTWTARGEGPHDAAQSVGRWLHDLGDEIERGVDQ